MGLRFDGKRLASGAPAASRPAAVSRCSAPAQSASGGSAVPWVNGPTTRLRCSRWRLRRSGDRSPPATWTTRELAPHRVLNGAIDLVEGQDAVALRRTEVLGQLEQAPGRARTHQPVQRGALQPKHDRRQLHRPAALRPVVVGRQAAQELRLEAEVLGAEQMSCQELQRLALLGRIHRRVVRPRSRARQVAHMHHPAHVLGRPVGRART